MKIEKGDLVQLGKFWDYKIGLCMGTDKDWWVIKNHVDVHNCIAEVPKDIKKIIKKHCVPEKYIKYL